MEILSENQQVETAVKTSLAQASKIYCLIHAAGVKHLAYVQFTDQLGAVHVLRIRRMQLFELLYYQLTRFRPTLS